MLIIFTAQIKNTSEKVGADIRLDLRLSELEEAITYAAEAYFLKTSSEENSPDDVFLIEIITAYYTANKENIGQTTDLSHSGSLSDSEIVKFKTLLKDFREISSSNNIKKMSKLILAYAKEQREKLMLAKEVSELKAEVAKSGISTKHNDNVSAHTTSVTIFSGMESKERQKAGIVDADNMPEHGAAP